MEQNQKRFTKAIVKIPCRAMVNGITTANLGQPDYEKALLQHADYIQALKECGLEVTILEADENFPDSCFVEDAALMTPHCAILSNPGAPSRNGEKEAMLPVIKGFYEQIEAIQSPGFCEPGDIMMCGSHFYIGQSERTNKEGGEQMIAILEKYGLSGSLVTLKEMLHLKTGVNFVENNNLLACGEFLRAD